MKICLCGSTRFMDQFHAANVSLSLAGHIVYSVATSTKGDFQPTEDQKIALDAVHLRKIEESDAIMVVGQQEDGSMYIGDSTRREIMFARVFEKPVYFFDPSVPQDGGGVKEFENDMRAASETLAMREARAEEERARQKAFMARFQRGGVMPASEDDSEIDHSDDPEASEQGEETH